MPSSFRPPRGYVEENSPRVSQVGHAAPPWLVNYADLMTELAIFFLMIYSLSAAFSGTLQKVYKEVDEAMKQSQIAGEVKMTRDGLQVSLEEKEDISFFVSGSAELLPEMKEYIAKIAPALKKGLSVQSNSLIVEGHTDNIPISTARFASNWELSTARATTVVKYLINAQGFPPDRIAAIGYGEFKPVKDGDTDAGRAKNRRVVFLIKVSGGKQPASSTVH